MSGHRHRHLHPACVCERSGDSSGTHRSLSCLALTSLTLQSVLDQLWFKPGRGAPVFCSPQVCSLTILLKFFLHITVLQYFWFWLRGLAVTYTLVLWTLNKRRFLICCVLSDQYTDYAGVRILSERLRADVLQYLWICFHPNLRSRLADERHHSQKREIQVCFLLLFVPFCADGANTCINSMLNDNTTQWVI